MPTDQQIEAWLGLPEEFEVTDGNAINQTFVYLRSLVVTHANMRFLLLMLSKSLRYGTVEMHFNYASFFSLPVNPYIQEDLSYLLDKIDSSGMIRRDNVHLVMQALDKLRYILLMCIRNYRLHLPFLPEHVDPMGNVTVCSEICYRIRNHNDFSIMLEKINPWKEY